MAQRKNLRSLAAIPYLRCLGFHVAQAEKSWAVPRRPSDGAGNTRKAALGFAVPEETFVRHGDVVGCSLPLAHHNGASSRPWFGWKLGRIVAVAEHTCQTGVSRRK